MMSWIVLGFNVGLNVFCLLRACAYASTLEYVGCHTMAWSLDADERVRISFYDHDFGMWDAAGYIHMLGACSTFITYYIKFDGDLFHSNPPVCNRWSPRPHRTCHGQ